MNLKQMRLIMDSHYKGQNKQMVNQINEYGLYDFWKDLKTHLHTEYINNQPNEMFNAYSNIVIAYHRITHR